MDLGKWYDRLVNTVMVVITVLGFVAQQRPNPGEQPAMNAPIWAYGLIGVGLLLAVPAILRAIRRFRGPAIEFFPDRESLVKAHGTLSARLENVSSASAIWVIGQKFYQGEKNTDRIKKLLLPNPEGTAFQSHIKSGPHVSAATMVREITELAKKSGTEVRWYDHFIFHSIVLADIDRRSGWIHVESVFPFSTTEERPSYTIYRRHSKKTVEEMKRIFDAIWKGASKQ